MELAEPIALIRYNAMQEFFRNVSRYPRYLITFGAGIFYSVFVWVKPMTQNRASALALAGFTISLAFLIAFTIRAMLGVVDTGLTPPPIIVY
jgi:hypothetical protein